MKGSAQWTQAKIFDRGRWERLADGLAIALAASLPWSTSSTTILFWLWLAAVIPTLDLERVRRVLATPAGGLPVLFVLLGLAGVLWAFGVPMKERWGGFSSIYKLLFIPLLMIHFQRSERGSWVMAGFVASCVALLVTSWLLLLMPHMMAAKQPGIPVKDYVVQSEEFAVCIFLLAAIAVNAWREGRWGLASALVLLDLVFLANMFSIVTSRTVLVVIPVLLLLFAARFLSRRGIVTALLIAAVLAGLTAMLAPQVKSTIIGLIAEVRDYKPDAISTRAGERIEFWKKSIVFIADAPLIGHGTGSILDQFRRVATGQVFSMQNVASANPHNQTFATAIQLGLLGAVVMFAMWFSHLLLFCRGGFAAWAGLVIVTQNIVGSLFNSHLFDFTQGWGYVVGVGVAGGMVLKSKAESAAVPGGAA